MQESLEQLQEVEKLIEEIPSVPEIVTSSIEDSLPLPELPQVDVPKLDVPSLGPAGL
jgi:hypothetical protein